MMPSRKAWVCALVFLTLGAGATAGAGRGEFGLGRDKDILRVTGEVTEGADAEPARITLKLAIASGWHINAHELDDEFLIPTEVRDLTVPDGAKVGELEFPEPELMSFSFSPDKLKVYEGTVEVGAELGFDAAPGPDAAITGKVRYQACNDKQCLPPATVPFRIALGDAGVASAGSVAPPPVDSQGVDRPSGAPSAPDSEAGEEGGILSGNMFINLLAIYFGGILLCLTPCVYPVIPVTIGYFGNQAQGSMGRSFTLASFYVLGMAVTYSSLGVAAALTGAMFGQWMQSGWVLGGMAAVMVVLALWSFGLFEIRLPSVLTSKAGARTGIFGALVMGLLMGVVAAPCIGPVVAGLVTEVGRRGDPVVGFLLFFVLALGLGTPFLFLAAFSGSLQRLPRSGAWMLGVKRLFGVLLLAAAVYFVGPIMDPDTYAVAWRLFAVGAVVYLLGFEPLGQAPGRLGLGFKIAFAASVFGVFWFAGGFDTGVKEGIPFQPYSENALESATVAGRPVLIDFTADWCIPCRELEHRTFIDPGVLQRVRSFTPLQADMTDTTEPEVEALRKRYDVEGPPTVLFLAPTGEEWRDLRVEGYVNAGTFRKHLDEALSRVADRTAEVADTPRL